MRLSAGLSRLVVPLLAGTLLASAALLPAPAVAAAVPVPAPKAFGAVADDFPHWEPESGCSPTQKPGAKALRTLLRRTYGTIASNTVRACTSADSGHEEGRAVDWMTSVRVPEQKAMAEAFLSWLLDTDSYGNTFAMARRLGVQYVIWNNRMFRLYDTARGWTEYSGCLAKKKRKRAYDNTCHRTHVHISLTWDGAYKRSSYASGYVACPAFPTPWGAAPALPTEGLDFVPVPPSRLLFTTGSTGTVNGPCRVRGGTRFDLPVLGHGGIPSDGVSAVLVRVSAYQPDSSTTVRVWPTGAARPADPVAVARPGQAAALVTVPVGVDGQISLEHSTGMSHLVVDVVGYYLAPGLVGDRFHPAGPSPALPATKVAARGTVTVDLAAVSGVPHVTAGLLSVTASGVTAAGGVKAYPAGGPVPPMSALSFPRSTLLTGSILGRTDSQGRVTLVNTSSAPVTMTVDLQGVYAPASVEGGLQLVPVTQGRLVSTAKNVGITGAMTSRRTATFTAVGTRGVPSTGVGAVLLYAVAGPGDANTYTTMWPEGTARPAVRLLSPRAGGRGADLVSVAPGATGLVAVRNAAGTSDLVVDVAGYFR